MTGQLILFSVQFSTQIFVARLLSPYEFGIAAIGFALAGLVNVIQSLGLRNLLIRERELAPGFVETVFTVNVILGVVIGCIIFAASYVVGVVYREPGITHMLWVIGWIPIVNCLEMRPSAMLQREIEFRPIAVAAVVKASISGAVTVGSAVAGASYLSIGYGAVAGSVASAIVIIMSGRQYVSFDLSVLHWRYVTRFGAQMLAISGVSNVSSRLVELIIGRLLGLEALGMFSRAAALNSILWENIHSVLSRVAFSGLADARRTTGHIHEGYIRAVDLITVVLWPAFAGLGVLAGPFVYVLYGDKWYGVVPILQIFVVAAIILLSITMLWEVYVISERTGEQARREIVRSALSTLFSYLGATFSLQAAAASRIVDAMVALGLYRQRLLEMTNSTNGELGEIYLRNAGLTFLAIAPASALMFLVGWRADVAFGLVLGSVLCGLVLWFLGAALMGHRVVGELALIARRVAGQRGK